MANWAWEHIDPSLPLPAAIQAINDRMRRLQSADGLLESVVQGKARASTTDATATTIYTEVLPPSTTTLSVGYVVARRTGGAAGTAEDGAAYRVEYVAKNNAGTATVIGSVITAIGESQAGWDVTLVASGGSVLVKVTGAASNNVSWRYARRIFAVAT